MKKDLLVCIAHHAQPDRAKYLYEVLNAFGDEYQGLTFDIIIDTNIPIASGGPTIGNVTIVSHVSLEHPFHLTWQHRRHMRDRIDDYRWFAYFEDDIYLPFANFQAYQRNFEFLWPQGFVPGCVRVEKYNGDEWTVDITMRQPLQPRIPHYVAMLQPYYGFWIMPQQALKETMTDNFVRLSDSREAAASYPVADLGRTALVQIDGGHVTRTSLAYHLPANYAPCPTSPHGKIRVEEIFA